MFQVDKQQDDALQHCSCCSSGYIMPTFCVDVLQAYSESYAERLHDPQAMQCNQGLLAPRDYIAQKICSILPGRAHEPASMHTVFMTTQSCACELIVTCQIICISR